MDTVSLNADKNNKIIKINHKNREPNKCFHQYIKKDQNLANKKKIQNNTNSGKQFQITPIILINNHLLIQIVEDDDHDPKENHIISHRTDLDSIVEIGNI